MELHKSETFQFGNVNPKPNIDDSNGPLKEAVNSLVCESDRELLPNSKKNVPVEEQQKYSSTIR